MSNSDIIKEYLVSLKAEVDVETLDKAEKELNKLQDRIQKEADKKSNQAAKEAAKIENDKLKAGEKATKEKTKAEEQAAKEAKKRAEQLLKNFKELVLVIGEIAAGFVVLTSAIATFAGKIANSQLEIQKFALSVYTTTQNARSLKTVMDSMGIKSLQDLRFVNLIPEQRKQFMALRSIASDLEPGAGTQSGMFNLREVVYAVQKLQVVLTYFWLDVIGTFGQIMKGPLKNMVNSIDKITNALKNNMSHYTEQLMPFLSWIAITASNIFRIIQGFSGLIALPQLLKLLSDSMLLQALIVQKILDGERSHKFRIAEMKAGIVHAADPNAHTKFQQFRQTHTWVPNLPWGPQTTLGKHPSSASIEDLKKFADKRADVYGVNRQVLRNLINDESGWNSKAVSSAGALGIAQFMPATAKGMNVDPMDPYSAIDGAARYLHNALGQFGGNYHQAVASYNAGGGAVKRLGWRGAINQRGGDSHYVDKILHGTNVTVNINGAGDPIAVGYAVANRLQSVLSTRNLQGSYA